MANLSRRHWLAGSVAAAALAPTAAWAEPGWVDRAVTRLNQQKLFLSRGTFYAGLNSTYWMAVAITNYVVGHVSSPQYGYDVTHGVGPTSNPERILERESGICGATQIVAARLATPFGMKTRPLYLWHDMGNHATLEYWWGGAWHWLDPTYGVWFRDPDGRPDVVLSLADVLALDPEDRSAYVVQDQTLLWAQIQRLSGAEPLYFLDAVPLRVESPIGVGHYAR